MRYLIGSKKEFFDFVDSIKKDDKIGILTHTDTDGIASAIFLEEILSKKGIKIEMIEFLRLKIGLFDEVSKKAKQKGITHLFLTDLSEGVDFEAFEKLRKDFKVFLIDHHPMKKEGWDKTNVIKTESADCSAWVIYELGKNLIDAKKWEWLVTATMVAEWSFNSEENLKFLIHKCEDINSKEDVFNSRAFFIAKIIAAANTCLENNLKKCYELVKEKNLEELEKYYEIVEEKLKKATIKYKEEAEYYPEKNMYFGYLRDSDLVSTSILISRISRENPENIFLILSDLDDLSMKVSARCQNGGVNELLIKGIEGLKNATAGGHSKASGGSFLKKDLEKFKKNILG